MTIDQLWDKLPWWVGLIIPVIWYAIRKYVKHTENKVDDMVVETIEEIIEDCKAGRDVRKEQTNEPVSNPQPITTPDLTEEQQQQLNQP